MILWPSPAPARSAVLYNAVHPILQSAAADRLLAWAERGTSTAHCFRIFRRATFGSVRTAMTGCRRLHSLPSEPGVHDVQLLGSRVFWTEAQAGNVFVDIQVLTTVGIGTRSLVLGFEEPCNDLQCLSNANGHELGPSTTGDGAFYYSLFSVVTDGVGHETVTDGSVHRALVGPHGGVGHPRLPGAPGAAFLAQAAGKLAVVPADISTPERRPLPSIEVRDDRMGAPLWSRPVTGTIQGLAMSRRQLIALVSTNGDQAIRIYRPSTGRLVAIVEVHHGVTAIACGGRHIAYAKAHRVFVRTTTSPGATTTSLVAHTRFTVEDLHLADGVVTWRGRRTIQGVRL